MELALQSRFRNWYPAW